jgi:hypothetical protein
MPDKVDYWENVKSSHWRVVMVEQIKEKISSHRRRIVPALVALSLLSGVMVSLLSTPSAQADYYKGCGYGYGLNGVFGYGFGDQVCPPTPTTTQPAGGGGGTTTTVSGGTTTTTATGATTTTIAVTTTTTPSGPGRLFANKVHSDAIIGRTVRLAITGHGFYAQPRVTSNDRGTRVGVQHDYGNLIIVKVTTPANSRPGHYTFTIRDANGKTCRVNYFAKY